MHYAPLLDVCVCVCLLLLLSHISLKAGDPAWADSSVCGFACSLPTCRSKGQIIRGVRAADWELNVITAPQNGHV